MILHEDKKKIKMVKKRILNVQIEQQSINFVGIVN